MAQQQRAHGLEFQRTESVRVHAFSVGNQKPGVRTLPLNRPSRSPVWKGAKALLWLALKGWDAVGSCPLPPSAFTRLGPGQDSSPKMRRINDFVKVAGLEFAPFGGHLEGP